MGATAVGKSSTSLDVAQALGGEIINADSMQLYRGMDIGTAKLTIDQRRGIAHHLLDIWPTSYSASVAEYQQLARQVVAEIQGRDRLPIFVGGSGLYVNAAIDNLQFPGTDPVIRAGLEAQLEEFGAQAMHDRLAALDPAAAAAILPGNGRRIVRAMEVIQMTGQPFQATLVGAQTEVVPAIRIGLRRPRPELDQRIEQRVDQMLDQGFVEEVRSLAEQGLATTPTASRALGYAQFLRYLDGQITTDQARTDTIVATRRFARKQESWFGRDKRMHWIDIAEGASPAELVNKIVNSLNSG